MMDLAEWHLAASRAASSRRLAPARPAQGRSICAGCCWRRTSGTATPPGNPWRGCPFRALQRGSFVWVRYAGRSGHELPALTARAARMHLLHRLAVSSLSESKLRKKILSSRSCRTKLATRAPRHPVPPCSRHHHPFPRPHGSWFSARTDHEQVCTGGSGQLGRRCHLPNACPHRCWKQSIRKTQLFALAYHWKYKSDLWRVPYSPTRVAASTGVARCGCPAIFPNAD